MTKITEYGKEKIPSGVHDTAEGNDSQVIHEVDHAQLHPELHSRLHLELHVHQPRRFHPVASVGGRRPWHRSCVSMSEQQGRLGQIR